MNFTYTPSSADWLRVLPELVLLAAAMLILLADLITPPKRKGVLALVGLLGVIGAGFATGLLFVAGDGATAFFDMIASDSAALLADAIILFAAGLGLLFSPDYLARFEVVHVGEYYALLLLAALGMMLMASASNLMVVFVGLELLSLALYILCAMLPGRLRSQEAGMKYFLLSSFASAFLLYGMALTYGSTGTTALSGIRAFLDAHPLSLTSGYGPLLFVALGLMAVGFSFKVAAVPFQAWTPDVYVGAPTPVTAFMSAGTKVAAFVALARVFIFALHPTASAWTPVFWVLAIVTMIGGNIAALTQRDVKRMLAYSSIATGGYMLIAAAVPTHDAVAALMIYLAVYAAMNVGAFGVVLALEHPDGGGTRLEDYAGLAQRRPWLAASMAVFLFSLAGIPALGGFIGKWYMFRAAVLGGHTELAIVGALASAVGIYYYLRVVWAMYFTEQGEEMATPGVEGAPTGRAGVTPSASATQVPGGVVAVAEPAAPARAPATVKQPLPIGVGIGLVLAVLATFALGILPLLLVQAADAAAAGLVR